MDVDGVVASYGFEVFRYVEADSADAAAEQALYNVSESRQLRVGARNPSAQPPTLRIAGVEELRHLDWPSRQQPGFSFYPEESEA